MEYGTIEREIHIDASPEIVFEVISTPRAPAGVVARRRRPRAGARSASASCRSATGDDPGRTSCR